MKKAFLWFLVGLMAFLPVLGMVGCTQRPPDRTDGPNDPSDPSNDPEGQDPSDLPSVPSEREVEVIAGSALHENTAELGRIPEGLAELVNKYMTSYGTIVIDGARTTFQTDAFSEAQMMPTDAVMAYRADKNGMANIVKLWNAHTDQYELHMMTIINRTNATNEYLSSDPSRMDQVMMDRDGNYMAHSGTFYYMMPNDEWAEYLWEIVEIALDTAPIKTIVFEEPDIYKGSGYSACFKREWEQYYGEPWQDQTSSPEAMLKSQQLKLYLLNRTMETVITRIKEKSPDTKVYLGTHSTMSLNIVSFNGNTGIATATNRHMATGLYDGIIGQTWSDTAYAPLTQDGNVYNDRFLAGYLGYASYIDSAGDLDLFTVVAPAGDGIGKNGVTEKNYYEAYVDTAVAQLIQPAINRFQVTVWPARSFESATQNYRAVQLSVIKAQNEVSGKAAVQSAGTPGISYVLSDTLSHQDNDSTTWAPSSNDSFLGVTLPLLSDGIPLTLTAMEHIKSADDLAGINVLLLSFDGQKPMEESVCKAIAEWVKQGGVCLYIGGHDAYDEIESSWWSASGTPLQAMLDAMELDVTVVPMQLGADARMEWMGDGKQTALQAMTCSTDYNSFYSSFDGNTNTILALEGHTVGIDEQVGKGHLIALSLPAALLAKTAGGSEVVRKLTEYACQYTDVKYDSTTLMWSKRGNVVAAHSIGQKNVLTGRYIDLFDARLTVHTHYVLDADQSALLYDITDLKATDVPVIAFSGGEITVQENTAQTTKFIIDSPAGSTVATRIMVPDGLYPKSISGQNYKGNIQLEPLCAWDSKLDTLLIHVTGVTRGAYLTIEWTTEPVEDYEMQQPAYMQYFAPVIDDDVLKHLIDNGKTAIRAVTTNAGNLLDEEFIIKNTAAINAARYYCDDKGEVIWKIDLNEYKNAYFAITVLQNYRLEVSTDGEDWLMVQDYIKVNGNRINSTSNTCIVGIDSKVYAKDADYMYVRLSNADPGKGYGGAVTQYEIYYNAPIIPETDPADYAPLLDSLATYDEAYASLQKVSVRSNVNAEDAEFIYDNRAESNQNCRFCDRDKELILKIDLTKYQDAVVALQICQNYRIQVSADGRTYVTAQDWVGQGNEWSKITTANMTYVILDSAVYAGGSKAMYVKLSACDPTNGWGARLESITVYYGGKPADVEPPVLPDVPALPEITPESYVPTALDLTEYDTTYFSYNKRVVKSNSFGEDAEFLHANAAEANASNRFCDRGNEFTLKFDLTKYQNAVIALDISQNYRVLISYDGRTFVTVQDWILAGNDRLENGANRTHVILDTTILASAVDMLYVKIDNAGPDNKGWGAALFGFTIYYTGDVVEESDILEEIRGYLPVESKDAQTREHLNATYASSVTVTVNNEHPGEDAAFVVPGKDTDQINGHCKFCDGARSLTYVFDLTQYKDAVIMFRIANNYNVRVSSDDMSWTTVQDYVNVNGGLRINNSSNVGWITIDSADFANGGNEMYVCFSNCGGEGGYGVAIYEFTVFYN